MDIFLIVILVVVVIFVLFIIGIYNRMVMARNKVKNQFAQIDVQLKNRFDMIPNLVNMVKGYMEHESETFKQVTEARNMYENAGTNISTAVEADNMLTAALGKLIAVAEAYPDLKANQNFLQLQADLKEVENNIRYARQFFNDEVMLYNNLIQVFPNNMFAGVFGFHEEKLLETATEERENVKVEF